MAGLLDRFLGPVGFTAPPPPIPGRSLTPPAPPREIASGNSGQLGPFLIPELSDWWLTRSQAWRVPACAQGLQVIAGTISTLPLTRWRDRSQLDDDTLVGQPDPAQPYSATMFQTVEDLVLYPHAYWLILGRSPVDDRAVAARYVPADQVADRLDTDGILEYKGVEYKQREVIRFDSPTPGLLDIGRTALRTAYLLERAAQRNADDVMPTGYLQNTSPVDLEDTEIDELLDGWAAARKHRATAYLNANVKYETTAFNAEQLQLVSSKEQAASEVARLMNLPPRYVNAPMAGGTSLTYTTVEGSRRDLVDLSLSVYMAPITDRLSMNDQTPRGQKVRFSLSEFYRADLDQLVTVGAAGTAAGLFTVTEWRRWAGLPDDPAADTGGQAR